MTVRNLALLAAVIVALPTIVSLTADASGTHTMGAAMPTGRAYTSAVWTGTETIIFGGGYGARSCQPGCAANDPIYDEIMLYHGPSSDSLSVAGTKLPTKRYGTSAVWTGQYAFVFGGFDGADLDQILRYDPSTATLTTMGAKLPGGRLWTSAVWTGTHAYIFGGYGCELAAVSATCNKVLDDILRYDPATDTLTTLVTALPSARVKTSAVWNGQYAFIFGGETCYPGTCYSNQVIRFDPATGLASTLGATFPIGVSGTAAVWDGDEALIFGGARSVTPGRSVHIFQPTNGTVWRQDARFATGTQGREGVSAVWTGNQTFLFGGYGGGYGCYASLSLCESVLEYDSNNIDAPVVAAAATGIGQLTLTWTAENDGQTGFEIWRYTPAGGTCYRKTFTLIATITGTNTSYIDAGLPNGQTNCYYVRLTSATSTSDPAETAAATTWQVPNAPTISGSRGPAAGQVTVTWTAPSTGGTPITEYRIYRGSVSGSLTYLGNASSTARAYVDGGLGDGSTWYYQVTAVNVVGESARSSEKSLVAPQLPSAPQNLRTTVKVPAGEFLAWDAPAETGGIAFKYQVLRGTTSGGAYTFLAEVPSTTREYQDTSCKVGTICYYVVVAVNSIGTSLNSNEISRVGTAP